MLTYVGLAALLSRAAFCQEANALPKFEIADVHISAKVANPFMRMAPVRGGRYELKHASMLDLIGTAYSFDRDKVLGGPSWLEMDRFDLVAKVPPDSNPETQKLMLQSLLEDRFKLAVHKDTKPLPTYALTVGKKPQLKEADGTGETGCRPQAATGAPAEGGGIRLMTMSPNGTSTTINLGPGMTIQYQCRNMTMAAFASGFRGMMGSSVGPNQVLDETGLKGAWNFDVKWSIQLNGPMSSAGDRITTSEALEKQLGLKLEQRQIPTPVLIVDSVDEKPGDNPPGVAEALPPIPVPTEFEVADVKPSSPDASPATRMPRFQIQPGGRLTVQGMPMRFLISRAFNTSAEQLAGVPKWADTERFDIIAKAAAAGPSAAAMDMEAIAPLIRSLLADRFKMTYHTEERPLTAYALVAAKSKMKKSDPASRTSCKYPDPPAGAPPGTRVFTCQNITMEQFADKLQNMTQELTLPVIDATELVGGWDISLTFAQNFAMMMGGGPGRGGDAAGGASNMPSASDPTGGYTIFQAMEKQLGLKLEMRKRTVPVTVIDRIEQKPTEN